MRYFFTRYFLISLTLVTLLNMFTLSGIGQETREECKAEFPDFERAEFGKPRSGMPEVYVFSEYSLRWFVWDEEGQNWMPVVDSMGPINPCQVARSGAPGFLIPAIVIKKCGEWDGQGYEYKWLKEALSGGE
jgi:hypothetical protein